MVDEPEHLGHQPVAGLLRSGSRSTSFITRVTNGTILTQSLFSAAALALDGPLPTSLSGNSIQIMLDAGDDETLPQCGGTEDLVPLARKMARWANDRGDALARAAAALQLPPAARNWRPSAGSCNSRRFELDKC